MECTARSPGEYCPINVFTPCKGNGAYIRIYAVKRANPGRSDSRLCRSYGTRYLFGPNFYKYSAPTELGNYCAYRWIQKYYALSKRHSPLRGEGELSAVGWSCFATKLGSRVQYANMVSGNSPLSKKCNFFEHFFGTLSKIP